MPAERETLARLRDVLARELETISIYERHSAEEPDPEMKALFQHLADEEKEHVTEVYEALLLRDAAQKEWATTGAHAQALRENRFVASAPKVGEAPSSASTPAANAAPAASTPAANAAPAAPAPSPTRAAGADRPALTVGSLIGAPALHSR